MMIEAKDPNQPSLGKVAATALITVAITQITTKLVEWGIEELKYRFASWEQEDEPSSDKKK
jgi:hypothetical protein